MVMRSHLLVPALAFLCVSYASLVAATPLSASSKSSLPDDQALNTFHDIVHLVQNVNITAPSESPNKPATISQSTNESFTTIINTTVTKTNYVRYPVTDSPTTLDLHTFGPAIPMNEFLQMVTAAIAKAFLYVGSGRGDNPINLGWFRFVQPFSDGGVVDFAVGDFRELGRSMDYFVLCDVLRGIADFGMKPEYGFHEVSFEVETKGRGYVGSGRVNYKPRSAVAVA